jgi:2-polyprenyl-6-methoxyphenol hydroxylase-like FAD-dependent oxidoreductase
VAAERHLIVAGAGIAGLTAALALARAGMRVTVLEQAEKLADTGAGIQLSPNATRVLIALGLREKLAAAVITPQATRVMAGGSGREVVRIPLGAEAENRYGAPYWVVHRGDLQSALATAANADQDIRIKLGVRVADFAGHTKGITVLTRAARDLTSGSGEMTDERGFGLVGADGLWSTVATRLRGYRRPRFAHRTAWRALIAADSVPDEFREPIVYLWLGLDAHLVHYPVKGDRLINIVGIVYDEWKNAGWSAAGDRNEIMRHFARWSWSEKARALIALPDQWLKWALYDRKAPFRAGDGAVTLIGDAAHPMLPFLAQGAGMAIEDAAVLGAMLARYRDDPADALRAYEGARWHRVARTQQASRKHGRIYGLTGPEAAIRNLGMRLKGGEKLRESYDWLYNWRPPELTRSESASA